MSAARCRGFTLLEVMVVVLILGLLASFVVPRIMERPDEARVVAAKSDIRAIQNALKLYRLDNAAYPSADQGLAALAQRPQNGVPPRNWRPYLDATPRDPWGNEYQYLVPGLHGEFDVFSFGADGRAGGEGVNADIGSWNLDRN